MAERWGGWSTAVGWLLRIFTNIRAFLAKAQNSDTVFPCVFTSLWQPLGGLQASCEKSSSGFPAPPLGAVTGWGRRAG